MTPHVILADDLSGAAESAAAALLRTTRIRIVLDASSAHPVGADDENPRVVAVDLDTRRSGAEDVATAVAGGLGLVGPDTLLLVKVDSLLRGRPDLLLSAVRDLVGEPGRPVLAIVSTATPALGRTLSGGVVHVGGTPLAQTGLWRAEGQATPPSVAEALGVPHADAVPLTVVRGPVEQLAEALTAAVASGVVVCDAEDEADLDAVVAAASAVPDVRPVFVGAGGLAAAASRSLAGDATRGPVPALSATTLLLVVGSAAPLLGDEVETLRSGGAAVVDLPVADLLAGRADVPLPGPGVTVVRPEPSDVDPTVSADLVIALADAVVPAASAADALVLTGGETARAVLSRLDTHWLSPVAATGGAVTARADDGRVVVIRPGSFGEAHSLADIVSSLIPALKEPS